ncbi:hypothetical protein V2W45_1325716 [Cenococcum geophilum]
MDLISSALIYFYCSGLILISRPNDISDPNSGIDSGININKCCNRDSGVNIDKDGDADNGTDIALGGNRDNKNSIRKGSNKYNRADTGNNASINSGEDIDKDSGAGNNFGNNIYKLIFKVAVKLFRKTLRAKPNDLDIFRTRVEKGLGKANALWSIIGLEK